MFDFLYSMLGLNLEFLEPIVDVLNVILIPVVSLLATAGTIYSIILGVNMAKADNADKRAAAKKKIISVLITCASVILLLFALKLILGNLDKWVNGTTPNAIIGLL